MNRFQRWILLTGGPLGAVALIVFFAEVPWPVGAEFPAVLLGLTLAFLALSDENCTATIAASILLSVTIGVAVYEGLAFAANGWNWKTAALLVWILFGSLIGVNKVLTGTGFALIDRTAARKSDREPPKWRRTLMYGLGVLLILSGLTFLVMECAMSFQEQRTLKQFDEILTEMESREETIEREFQSRPAVVPHATAATMLGLIDRQLEAGQRALGMVDKKNEQTRRWKRRVNRIGDYIDSARKHQQILSEIISSQKQT